MLIWLVCISVLIIQGLKSYCHDTLESSVKYLEKYGIFCSRFFFFAHSVISKYVARLKFTKLTWNFSERLFSFDKLN